MGAGGEFTIDMRISNSLLTFISGNSDLYLLTESKPQELRIDLMNYYGDDAFAHYESFHVDSGANQYLLSLGAYSGTAGGEQHYAM